MGQYGNQPDFGTEAEGDVLTVSKNEAADRKGYLGGACLYVGTAGDLNVIIAVTHRYVITFVTPFFFLV